MRVVIAGGHGKIAVVLERQLAQRGDEPVALVRNPDHADDVRAAGAEPLVVDLEAIGAEELAGHLRGADAVVFAAGAGPGSTAERKRSVDRDAALLLADAAAAAGVRRYLLVSSMGAQDAPSETEDDSIWAPTCAPSATRSRASGTAPTSTPPSCGRAGSPTSPRPAG
jgi:uncharacterized protein YbjT (DUF2867 family)